MVANSQNDPQFDAFADEYRQLVDRSVSASGESSEYFANIKARYAEGVLGQAFSGTLLDFGCGVGLLSQALLNNMPHAQLDGFDPSQASISCVAPDLRARASFTSTHEDLGKGYDAITVANVFHHVPPDQRLATLSGLAKHLSTHGRLFVFEHNPANPLTVRAVDQCPFDKDAVLLHPREIRKLCAEVGLRVLRVDYIVFFPRWLKQLRTFESRLRWCPMGAQWVAVAELET